MKEIFESHVGSAWQTGRGRKADDNFFFDKFYMKLQHVCSACTVKLRFESSVISQGCKTNDRDKIQALLFESSVISQEYKTNGFAK